MRVDIVSPENVSAEWLNAVLRSNGLPGSVSSFEKKPIGSGLLAESVRFDLHYEPSAPDQAPRAMVGKFPSSESGSRETCRQYHLYRNEVLFYRDLAPGAGMYVPKTLATEYDEASDGFVLMFEDLSHCRAGNQLDGITPLEAKWALREAARLHAAYWDDQEVAALPWVSVPETAQDFYSTELIEQTWDNFQSQFAGRIAPEVKEVCDRFVKGHAAWNVALDTPKCLSHNDFRPDNMLIDEAAERIATVDWQTVSMIGPGMDVSFLIGGSMPTDARRACEASLLDHYYRELVERGVREYSLDHFYRDYRHYCFAGIAVAMVAISLAKRTPRGDAMFLSMMGRHVDHVLDVGGLQLLDA